MEPTNSSPEILPEKDSLLKSIGWSAIKLIAYGVAVILISLGLIAPLGMVFQGQNESISKGDLSEGNIWVLIITWGMALIASILVTFFFCRYIEKKPLSWAGFTMRQSGRSSLVGFIWGAGMVTLGFLVLFLFGWVKIAAVDFLAGSLLTWALFLFLAAAFEEVLLRGYIMNMFERHFNTKIALIVSSLIFGFLHVPNANVSFIGILNIILAGVILGIAYLESRNLWFPTMLHFAWNYFQGIIYGFEVSGNKTYSLIQQELAGPAWLTGGDFGFEGSILSVLVLLWFLWYYRKQLIVA
ncbi:MAG: type II CAAX endopeptidase family protein [Bacteroidota bacterium]